MLLAVLAPQMAEGVSPTHVQRSAKPLPAEPVWRFRLGALRLGPQPLIVLLLEAKAVQSLVEAVVIAHAADTPLGQRGREAVLEISHGYGFPAWDDLAEFTGPEVADTQPVLQECGH